MSKPEQGFRGGLGIAIACPSGTAGLYTCTQERLERRPTSLRPCKECDPREILRCRAIAGARVARPTGLPSPIQAETSKRQSHRARCRWGPGVVRRLDSTERLREEDCPYGFS